MAILNSANLTSKEKEIARLIADGKTDKEIAAELNISTGTVAVHNKNLYKKLKIHSRAELIKKSGRWLDDNFLLLWYGIFEKIE